MSNTTIILLVAIAGIVGLVVGLILGLSAPRNPDDLE